VTTSESLLFQLVGKYEHDESIDNQLIWVGDASNPLFKPFAGLVKEEKETTAKALQTLCEVPRSNL
jgi:hypothetical protein